MASTLYTHIEKLAGITNNVLSPLRGNELKQLQQISNAWLFVKDGIIADFGEMKNLPSYRVDETVNCEHQTILPTWCDSHTHLVYAATREDEFVDRINGLSYQEIAARGGGILNSAKKIATASEEELVRSALLRLSEVVHCGTGAIEIKTGYGLTVKEELKMLRVIEQIKSLSPIPVKATLLAAHAVPAEYKLDKKAYIDTIVNELIPEAAKLNVAEFCDVFCEENYFTPDETVYILEAGKKHGMQPKVHANQLAQSGGVQAGIKTGAISVDHLEYVLEPELEALKNSSTIATILPGAQFFLQLPYPPARKMLDNNIALSIASDYNPGSSPSGNMSFMISLACIHYKLNPEEAINAATINGAFAMNVNKTHGSIEKGKIASFMITKKGTGYPFIAYSFANNTIDRVIIAGKKF
ncbi:MAG TPA: imidazolonepropionase [Flavobacteriales bacterium]|nr:imidazolonepropionase [Flavobacteriales bacterium]